MLLQKISPRTRRRGTIAVMVAVSLVAILGVVALSLDGGSMFEEKRHAQATADAAALAAAADLYEYYWTNSGTDPNGTAKASAFLTAANNGFNNDGTTNTVTVNIPPLSGDYQGKAGYVEVIVDYNFTRSFSSIFSTTPVSIRARSVALGSPIAADVGILVLDPTSRSAFNAQGSGTTTVKGTPVVVNSSDPEGSIVGGGGSVAADSFWLKGGYSTSGGGTFIGPIYLNRPGLADPLADIPPPNPTTMSQQSTRSIQYTSGDIYLQPGVYTGGINVSGTGNLYLAPGIYYMQGGGFEFSGQGSLVGQNVMIYSDPGNGNADKISVTGQGSMIITAPAAGPYQGITFWQRRDSTNTGNISGTGGTTSITGTFYFPGALLQVSGNGGVANLGSQYISYQLNLGGNGGINIDWVPRYVARKRFINLVE